MYLSPITHNRPTPHGSGRHAHQVRRGDSDSLSIHTAPRLIEQYVVRGGGGGGGGAGSISGEGGGSGGGGDILMVVGTK